MDTTRAVAHLRQCFTFDYEKDDNVPVYCDGIVFRRILWQDRDAVHADLARIYASMGQFEKGLSELNQALLLNPHNSSAALLLAEVLRRPDHGAIADSLAIRLERDAPDNPALPALKMTRATSANDSAAVLRYADQIAATFTLPAPSAQPSQDVTLLGNFVLQPLQTLYAAKYEKPQCLAIIGWIYACQGRYNEADSFLQQSHAANPDARTAERWGQVKARLNSHAQ